MFVSTPLSAAAAWPNPTRSRSLIEEQHNALLDMDGLWLVGR